MSRLMAYGDDWPPREASPAAQPSLRSRALRRVVYIAIFYVAAAIVVALVHRPFELGSTPDGGPRQESGPMWHKDVPDPAKIVSNP